MAGSTSTRLSRTARELILDNENDLLVSAVSIYEIELKAKRGRGRSSATGAEGGA